MSKICPLMFTSTADLEDFECRPNRCAWACGTDCALVAIAHALEELNDNGLDIYGEEGLPNE